MRKIIELKGISRTYGNGDQARTVLKNVDLTIMAGEMVAIIGRKVGGILSVDVVIASVGYVKATHYVHQG